MRYLLDIHSKPPMVVLASLDESEVKRVGQLYADQVGRPLVVALGPAPQDATFRPTVPDLEPVVPPGSTGVGTVERVGASETNRIVVSYDPDRLTKEQRDTLAGLGITL